MSNKIQALDPQNVTANLPIDGPIARVPLTPMDMLARAVSSGADIEVLEKLMGLQERWQANQARMDFDAAVAQAKREIPVIIKNAIGHNNKKYANFAAIASAVDPVLGNHGLSYRFRCSQTEKAISVTCILSHKSGHSEETTLTGPADNSGNKSPIQSIGSTLTYLQRYALVQMLGVAATEDDDGRSSGMGSTISDAQLAELEGLARDVKANHDVLCKLLKVETLSQLPARQFDSAMALLKAKRDAMKKSTKGEAQ